MSLRVDIVVVPPVPCSTRATHETWRKWGGVTFPFAAAVPCQKEEGGRRLIGRGGVVRRHRAVYDSGGGCLGLAGRISVTGCYMNDRACGVMVPDGEHAGPFADEACRLSASAGPRPRVACRASAVAPPPSKLLVALPLCLCCPTSCTCAHRRVEARSSGSSSQPTRPGACARMVAQRL